MLARPRRCSRGRSNSLTRSARSCFRRETPRRRWARWNQLGVRPRIGLMSVSLFAGACGCGPKGGGALGTSSGSQGRRRNLRRDAIKRKQLLQRLGG